MKFKLFIIVTLLIFVILQFTRNSTTPITASKLPVPKSAATLSSTTNIRNLKVKEKDPLSTANTRPSIDPYSRIFNGDLEFDESSAVLLLGVDGYRAVSEITSAFIEEWNAHTRDNALNVPSNGKDLRVYLPPTKSVQEAKQLRENLLDKISQNITPEAYNKFLPYLKTKLNNATGDFGASPRLLIVVNTDPNEDKFNKYKFYDYVIDNNGRNANLSPEDFSKTEISSPGVVPYLKNLRTSSANKIPASFSFVFSFEDGMISAFVRDAPVK